MGWMVNGFIFFCKLCKPFRNELLCLGYQLIQHFVRTHTVQHVFHMLKLINYVIYY